MHFVYIVYSKSRNKFYTGETHNIEQRILWHNSHFFDQASTKIASDWILYLLFELKDTTAARKMEAYIKSQKSSKYIKALKSNEQKRNILLEKFGGGHCPDTEHFNLSR